MKFMMVYRVSQWSLGGALGALDTKGREDGNYEIRLAVSDTLGLTGVALIPVTVDNEAPFVEETTPVVMSAVTGGHVFTTNREAHLYFPPRTFTKDALVTIAVLEDSAVPNVLPAVVQRVLAGYNLFWGEAIGLIPGVVSQKITEFLVLYDDCMRNVVQNVLKKVLVPNDLVLGALLFGYVFSHPEESNDLTILISEKHFLLMEIHNLSIYTGKFYF